MHLTEKGKWSEVSGVIIGGNPAHCGVEMNVHHAGMTAFRRGLAGILVILGGSVAPLQMWLLDASPGRWLGPHSKGSGKAVVKLSDAVILLLPVTVLPTWPAISECIPLDNRLTCITRIADAPQYLASPNAVPDLHTQAPRLQVMVICNLQIGHPNRGRRCFQ